MMSSHRRISAAVDAVCDAAARDGALSVDEVVGVVSRLRRRRIEVHRANLAPGLCGEHRGYDDRDVIVVSADLPDPDRTLAHELGHIVLGHRGSLRPRSVNAAATHLVLDGADAPIEDPDDRRRDEWEAETFAGLLQQQMRRRDQRGSPNCVATFDQALG